MGFPLRHSINASKALTSIVVFSFMVYYNNFELGPCIYLALHGTYGILWILKDYIYPDPRWQKNEPLYYCVSIFLALALFWLNPFWLIKNRYHMSPPWAALCVSMFGFGVFFHFVSDAQKYYTLKFKKGLIDSGMFARCRNINYFGELLIYSSFALAGCNWSGAIVLVAFIIIGWIPGMKAKERSLSRHPGWKEYQARSGFLFPKLF
eukprot:gb/GECH01003461.1/.p1 GENE.gb/GECH01003461.1/~~gb/GECH01003461.1/.p1  ORF type:complete len:207 (+),score=30.44 gb/GECH01003461.1/:1-621(+)